MRALVFHGTECPYRDQLLLNDFQVKLNQWNNSHPMIKGNQHFCKWKVRGSKLCTLSCVSFAVTPADYPAFIGNVLANFTLQ